MMLVFYLTQLLLVLFPLMNCSVPKKPHIIAILMDDFGWADVGWHRPPKYKEISTPVMDDLVKNGIELDRHYVFKFCSPSRSAAQSGRNPIHVNVQNLDPYNHNPGDTVSGYSAIPRNMTGIAAMLKKGGYATHFTGKWDCGMATSDHTPKGRGYDTSLFYYHHMNDYWMGWFEEGKNGACNGTRPIDLWMDTPTHPNSPARGLNNTDVCSVGDFDVCDAPYELKCSAYPGFPDKQVPGCTYEDALFSDFVLNTVEKHDSSTPFFFFWASHIVHSPLQVPKEYLDRFDFIDDWRRRRYHAMVFFLDEAIGNLISLLKKKGMYNDTVIFFSADNGGPVYSNGSAGANNYPLRGGKASNWEGGVRVNAWVHGGPGVLSVERRGLKLQGLTTIWDWYTTFAGLASVDPTDHRAAEAGLPPIDGIDMWPYIMGTQDSSPRLTLALGSSLMSNGQLDPWGTSNPSFTNVNGIIVDQRRSSSSGGLYKLLTGNIMMSGWQGMQFPNMTGPPSNFNKLVEHCGKGCLFRLDTDPTEHTNLAATMPEKVSELTQLLIKHNASVFSPVRGPSDQTLACNVAFTKWNGFWGPFL